MPMVLAVEFLISLRVELCTTCFPCNQAGKWNSWTQTGHRHGRKLGRGHKLKSGGHGPLPIVTAVCEQD